MPALFHLLDLPSQALAVQHLLSGRPEAERLAWLCMHGRLVPIEARGPGGRPVYHFESGIGLGCVFFIDVDEFVFFGDHTIYTVRH